MLVICGAFVMAMADGTGVAVALRSVQRHLGLDKGQLQWVMPRFVAGVLMVAAVRETFERIHPDAARASVEQIEAWLLELEKSFRYAQDVFA